MDDSGPEQALLSQLSPRALLRLFDLLPDVSFFMKDRQCRFVALNLRACEYCGVRSEQDAIGLTDEAFFPHARAAQYMADDQAVMTSGRPILNRIEPAPEMAGSPRLVATSKIPLRDARGRIIGIAGFSRHIQQTSKGSTARLSEILEHIHKHHAEPVTTATLARLAGMSASQLERTFRRTTGTTPRQYLMRTRVEAACRRLTDTDETLAAVAHACGFYDHAHFTRCFRTIMGLTPSAYRHGSSRAERRGTSLGVEGKPRPMF